jgi:hypothetical protein
MDYMNPCARAKGAIKLVKLKNQVPEMTPGEAFTRV